MPSKTGSIGTGYFIRFDEKEAAHEAALLEYLEAEGYEKSPEGIKKLLLDLVYEEEESPKSKRNTILETLRENPDEAARMLEGIGNLAGTLLNKKLFKK